ncbi:MAG: hypothetical protein KDK53_09050 [Maritimibacter sp.]|nr:hypothetical protein [Maritimibacter sp.]
MAKISTEGWPVQVIPLKSSHKYPISLAGHMVLIFKDDDGREFQINAGPANESYPWDELILRDIGSPLRNRYNVVDGSKVGPAWRGNTKIDFGGRDAEDIWAILLQHAQNIHNADFAYNAIKRNSNTVIGALLDVVGIDVRDFQPDPRGVMLTGFTGKNTRLAFDYDLTGTDAGDFLRGRKGQQVFTGLGGGDQLVGGHGQDRLIGNAGRDLLLGGSGRDLLRGGSGDDALRGGAGNDVLRGGRGQDELVGGLGDDKLFGAAGNDRLKGKSGQDLIEGGDGRDRLVGGDGADVLKGGDGNDRLIGEAGHDRLYGNDGADVLKGGDGRDRMSGGSGDDSLLGGDGGDLIKGGVGADTLDGGDGDDQLFGGAGDDVLRGGAGDDTLRGGAGVDRLVGDEGADRFVFADLEDSGLGPNADRIAGFVTGEDRIDLAGLADGFTFSGAGLTGTGPSVALEETDGHTRVRVDADGDGTADLEIVVKHVLGLGEDDFIF